MAWTISDKGEPANDLQSILFQEYLEVLVAGISGVDSVLVGCAVTTAGTNLTLDIAKGAVMSNNVMFPVTAGTVTIGTADATNPRLDLVVINSSGTKAVRAGTAAANPKPPARTANDVVLAVVYVPANDTVIATNQITDMRVFSSTPTTIYRTTTAETTNTTAAAIEILNKANSGVTIPNGLFLAGKILRVRIGGNILTNSGTPTIDFAIRYGGTTIYDSVASGATTASANRRPFWVEFYLVAQANNDQAMNGMFWTGILGAPTNPTTGIGSLWLATQLGAPIGGSAAVDSDAADRLLSVIITLSVSNVANEVVVEMASVELL